MKIEDRLMRRKLGAFELLVILGICELVFGSGARAALLLLLSLAFYCAKKEFRGEFSLLDVFELFTNPK